MQVKPIKTRIFQENEDMLAFVLKHVKKIPERSVLVITSKITSLSEGRTVSYRNAKEKTVKKADLIKKESSLAVETKKTWLTIRDGMILASAGIDESNAKDMLILLPKNSFKYAEMLRRQLMEKFHLENFGVLITDSRLMPLRAGALGVAIGYAGFKGIKSYIGTKDIFGKVLKMSRTDVADSLATSAVLTMGEGKEQQPLAIITGAPIVFTAKVNKRELIINPEDDMYGPLLKVLQGDKKRKTSR